MKRFRILDSDGNDVLGGPVSEGGDVVSVQAPRCTGPRCTRAAVRNGLCHAHSAQAARGTTLHPLRPVRPALPSVSLRVSEATREAVLADVEGARAALVAWARRR